MEVSGDVCEKVGLCLLCLLKLMDFFNFSHEHGEKTQLRSNLEPSCSEVALLTNEPVCCQTPLINQRP